MAKSCCKPDADDGTTTYWRITVVAMNVSQATWITFFEFFALVSAIIYAAALASNSFFAEGT